MIDAGQLVSEKKYILDKKITNTTRKELFPLGHIEYRQPRRGLLQDPMKLKASPAHSHKFMENLLLKALKKAGYENEKEQSKETVKQAPRPKSLRPIRHNDLNRGTNKGHRKESTVGVADDADSLLVNSAFDDCYFSKLD